MKGVKYNTESWIQKANAVHNNKYNYDLVDYTKSYEKVNIICLIHGTFKQVAVNHLMGNGCPKCGKSFGTEKFITKAKLVHGNKYDYSKSIYTKMKNDIIIKCNLHGDFKTKAAIHLKGFNCPKCNIVDESLFIKKAIKVHGKKYDYYNLNYTKFKNKVNIFCKHHGFFLQRASAHLEGQGCPSCNLQINKFKLSSWNKINKGKKVYFYIIKCWDENEEFFKVGISKNFKKRYNSKTKMPYNFKIIHLIESFDTSYIWKIEKEIITNNKMFKYIPNIKFGGSRFECFDKNLCTDIKKLTCANIK